MRNWDYRVTSCYSLSTHQGVQLILVNIIFLEKWNNCGWLKTDEDTNNK